MIGFKELDSRVVTSCPSQICGTQSPGIGNQQEKKKKRSHLSCGESLCSHSWAFARLTSNMNKKWGYPLGSTTRLSPPPKKKADGDIQLKGEQGVPAKNWLARHKRILIWEPFWTESELARFLGHPGELCLEYRGSKLTSEQMRWHPGKLISLGQDSMQKPRAFL